MHILILILLLLFTGGCAGANRPGPGSAAMETALFIQGLHEVGDGGKSPSFDRLRIAFPESPWNEEAQTILDLAKELKEQNSRLASLQQDKTRCHRDKDQLKQENSQLRADQEKLKNLIIEIERRAK